LQVRDALTLEELTRGHHTPASTTASSSTSRALVAAPPPSSASPPASLLGAPPPGPSGGGGRGGRRGRRGRSGGGRGTPPTQAPTPPLAPSSRRCALADRRPPVVKAYLHVALPGSGRRASSPAPAGGHGHECCLLRADRDSTSFASSSWPGGGIKLP
jgi:hypothetical protein